MASTYPPNYRIDEISPKDLGDILMDLISLLPYTSDSYNRTLKNSGSFAKRTIGTKGPDMPKGFRTLLDKMHQRLRAHMMHYRPMIALEQIPSMPLFVEKLEHEIGLYQQKHDDPDYSPDELTRQYFTS